MAATSATLSLTSTSTLVENRAPRQSTITSSLQCPNLSASLNLSQNRPLKATVYCHKVRNVLTMATTDIVTPEVAPPAEDAATETPEILKAIQAVWDSVENKPQVSSLAVAGLITLVGINGMISEIERLPLVPGVFELVGIGYTGWFAYENLIFTPDREALIVKIENIYKQFTSKSVSE